VDQSVKGIFLDGIVPSLDNAMNVSYPVVRKRYMNTKGEPPKLVKAFIECIMSLDGAVIIVKSGSLLLKLETGEHQVLRGTVSRLMVASRRQLNLKGRPIMVSLVLMTSRQISVLCRSAGRSRGQRRKR